MTQSLDCITVVAMRGINVEKVSRWLEANIAGATAPFEFSLIAGGRSNLTFKVVDSSGRKMVLRRPPLGQILATAHNMEREHRLISAVGKSNVPVPIALGVCTDTDVNDAHFYVMDWVDGEVLDSQQKAKGLPKSVLATAADDLVDVLADLHAVDVDAVGLGDLARRDGYVERQVKRWSTQWASSKTREVPEIDEVARILAAHIPPQQGSGIAHGDYRFGNCLVDTSTGKINAVLDWELCTLGDPLADVGYLGVYWAEVGEKNSRENDPTGVEGFPTYKYLVDRYAKRTGRDVSEIDYYVAFGNFRLAVIAEGVYARYIGGVMGDDNSNADWFRDAVPELAQKALAGLQRLY